MPIQEDVIVNYIISDIHGAFNEFKQMLEKIEYNPDSDTMIVAGDVIDRGSDSIELLYYIKDFVDSGQMILLAGNHEFFCAEFIEGGLPVEKYAAFGGRATIKDIIGMPLESKTQLLHFLKSLPVYYETTTRYGRTVVTHSGIVADSIVVNYDNGINVIESINNAVNRNKFDYLISDDIHRLDVFELERLDRFVIVGHVPTMLLNIDGSNTFYREGKYMCIDSGAGYPERGGQLSCYCIETDEQIYL